MKILSTHLTAFFFFLSSVLMVNQAIGQATTETGHDFGEIETGHDFGEIETGHDFGEIETGHDFGEIETGHDFGEIETGHDFGEIETGHDFGEIETGHDFGEIETGHDFGEIEDLPESIRNANAPVLDVYPNPTFSSVIRILYNKVNANSTISITNLVGEVYARALVSADNQGSGSLEFNVANLANGIYLVSLQSGMYNTVKRVIVQR